MRTPLGGDDGLGGYMPLAVAANDNNGISQLTSVHANHMGVPALFTDATGSEIPFPTTYAAPGFPGQNRTLADLYYNRHRDYDPTTGRYIQADPIGLAGGTNPYSYAMNNPLAIIDPLGLHGDPMKYPGGRMRNAQQLHNKYAKDCPEVSPPPPPPVDWCGSKGFNVWDGNWAEACKNHDYCYGRPGAFKERCDGQLALEIAAECTENSYIFGLPVCGIVGVVYGGGLALFGVTPFFHPARDAYNDAQKKK